MLIIGFLRSVIVPNYNKIQLKAKERAVIQTVSKLQIAIESYHLDIGLYPDGESMDVGTLEELLVSNSDLSEFSKNPFTGEAYTANDVSGMITYSFDDRTNSYHIVAFGYQNNEEIVNIGN